MTPPPFNGLIQNKEPYFFLHIHKTAGTSFTSILDQLFQAKAICPVYYTFELKELAKAELATYRLFQGHIYYNVLQQQLDRPLHILTFVRNPIEHAVSFFHEFKRVDRLKSLAGREIYNRRFEDVISGWEGTDYLKMSLAEFVFNDLNYQNLQVRRLIENTRYASFDAQKDPPSSVIIIRANPGDLAQAKELLANAAFVGITERFEESLLLFTYLLGIRPTRAMPHLNSSADRPSLDDISPEIFDTINSNNALDGELYAFACQLFEERFTAMWHDLLNRYCATPAGTGAEKVAPAARPSNQVIYDLLAQHYQANFKALNPPLTTLSYTLDQPLSGEGWYMRENDPNYGFIRWSGPGPSASLDLPLAAQVDLCIRVEILNALKKELVESLSLDVNEVEVPLTFSYSRGFKTLTYEGVIKAETLQRNPGLATLRLRVSETIDLGVSHPEGGDSRTLGIALKKIETAPA